MSLAHTIPDHESHEPLARFLDERRCWRVLCSCGGAPEVGAMVLASVAKATAELMALPDANLPPSSFPTAALDRDWGDARERWTMLPSSLNRVAYQDDALAVLRLSAWTETGEPRREDVRMVSGILLLAQKAGIVRSVSGILHRDAPWRGERRGDRPVRLYLIEIGVRMPPWSDALSLANLLLGAHAFEPWSLEKARYLYPNAPWLALLDGGRSLPIEPEATGIILECLRPEGQLRYRELLSDSSYLERLATFARRMREHHGLALRIRATRQGMLNNILIAAPFLEKAIWVVDEEIGFDRIAIDVVEPPTE